MSHDSHPVANAIVTICGIIYVAAWSFSFYPQIFLNFKRKSTVGLSPDFVYVNPLGFLALSLWNWGMYFSPLARRQYQSRHDGHLPQVALADLAFSTHAFLISLCTFSQVLWYARRTKTASGDERDRLIPTPEERNKLDFETSSTPSIPCRLAIAGIFIASLVSAFLVWIGKAEWLDWLYFASAVKLFVSVIKFMPQVILNWRLRSVEGFAIGQILADLTGSTFSFTQLVVSSLAIEHDPSGIFANPAKLGLAGVSLGFDLVFLVQKYWLFRGQTMERRSDSGDEDLGE